MYRTNSNGSQILRRFVQQAESYNRCMFKNNSLKQTKNLHDHVTEQILFCQNQFDNLNISEKKKNSAFVSYLNKSIFGNLEIFKNTSSSYSPENSF
jgi:isoleucyl-tRNA synthetase